MLCLIRGSVLFIGIKGLLTPLLLLLKEALKIATLADCGVSMIAPLKPSLISSGACEAAGGVLSRLVGCLDDTLGVGVEKILLVACGPGFSCDGDASEPSSLLFFRNADGRRIVDCPVTSAEKFLDGTLLNVTPVCRGEDIFFEGSEKTDASD
jgi:hypothetical protein